MLFCPCLYAVGLKEDGDFVSHLDEYLRGVTIGSCDCNIEGRM